MNMTYRLTYSKAAVDPGPWYQGFFDDVILAKSPLYLKKITIDCYVTDAAQEVGVTWQSLRCRVNSPNFNNSLGNQPSSFGADAGSVTSAIKTVYFAGTPDRLATVDLNNLFWPSGAYFNFTLLLRCTALIATDLVQFYLTVETDDKK